MKTEIQHFTDAPEIQHFAVVKVNKNDNVYGVTWGDVVREYLKTAYSDGSTQAEVISYGKTYKVLKREEITVFYDADGNTLFDVENKRLEKEYGYVMKEDEMIVDSVAATEEEKENITDNGTDNDVIPMGTASLKEIVTGLPEPTAEEIAAAKEENDKPVKQMAKEKLEKEMKDAKDKTFAEPVIGHLLKRCDEDDGLAQDVMQEHKTWEKCYKYIFEQARKQAKENRAAVRDDVVYEWAEDYYHKDDKAEEERKAKEAAERRKKCMKAAEKKATDTKNVKQNAKKEDKAEEKSADLQKSKKNPKEIDGQMDLFSMMGM